MYEGEPGGAQSIGGLTEKEAEALASQGETNRLPKSREGSVFSIFRKNIFTLFNLLNVVLALLLLGVGSYRNMLFLGVVVCNTVIGVVQELRAKRMHDRLRLLSQGTVRVLRDGQEKQLPPSVLVRTDVVRLSRGDQVPADGEVLEGSCEADESLLTGESEPIAKKDGDALKSGSFLTEGSVTARLTAVGVHSYAGKLQMAARKVKRPRSELMDNMQKIIRRVSVAIVPLGLLLFWKQTAAHHLALPGAVTKTVAAVLGMIPEGLVLLTSVALTVGVLRLGKQNALVNELYGIESLARTDVVCMDKTGTLTSGEMRLTQVIPLRETPGEEIDGCAAAILSTQKEASATQNALLQAFPPSGLQIIPQALQTVPFSSERKWSAACFGQSAWQTLVLGAPEKTLTGFPQEEEQARALAKKGMRVLALLQTTAPLCGKTLPEGLRPLALLCLEDALRPEVRETVRYFGEEGVTLKILSGDSPLTVAHVAAQAGVPFAENAIDLSCCEGPVDYDALCETYTVFGRVSPEDKRGLIEALKQRGHGVAMVGDGVNDIPALKAADCSIAMASGSDAACRVAQITLLTENFAVLPQIVLEGRRVINNITRASSLFLVKNIFSFLLTAALLALPYVYPFIPIQLTLISTLTIGVPSFVLAFQPSQERIRGNFMRNVLLRALPGGICVGFVTLALCALKAPLAMSQEAVGTLSTVAAGYAGLWVLLMICRPFNWLRGGLVLSMALLLMAAMWFVPDLFDLVPLAGKEALALAAVLVATPLLLGAATVLVRRLWRLETKPVAVNAEAAQG